MKHNRASLNVSSVLQVCFYLISIGKLVSDSFPLLFKYWKVPKTVHL